MCSALRGTYREWLGPKKNFIVFWNHFSPRFMLLCSLWAENIFSVFRSMHVPLDTQFWTWGFTLVMLSRKEGLTFATRARKRELCLYSYLLQVCFIVFLEGNHPSPRFMLPCSLWAENIFRFFEVCNYPSIHNFGLKAISEGRPPLSNTSSEAGVLPLEVRIENDSDRKWS